MPESPGLVNKSFLLMEKNFEGVGRESLQGAVESRLFTGRIKTMERPREIFASILPALAGRFIRGPTERPPTADAHSTGKRRGRASGRRGQWGLRIGGHRAGGRRSVMTTCYRPNVARCQHRLWWMITSGVLGRHGVSAGKHPPVEVQSGHGSPEFLCHDRRRRYQSTKSLRTMTHLHARTARDRVTVACRSPSNDQVPAIWKGN